MNLKHSNIRLFGYSTLLLLFFALPLKAQVTIGAQQAPHSYSLLELTAAQKAGGLRLPMLSNDERDALKLTPDSTEASGLVIYNTDIDCVEFWSSGKWIDLCSATPLSSIVNSITLSSAAGTDAQTVCDGAAIEPITYATTGATGATFVGLPAGVTGSWNADVVTISGTPATSSNYIVALTGGSGSGMAIGTITVNTVPKLTIIGNNGVTKNATTTYSVSPVSGIANYTWTVSGTDWSIVSGQGSNSITVTSGADNGTITVSAINSCGAGTASMDVKVGCPVKTISGSWLTFMCYNLGAKDMSITDQMNYTPNPNLTATTDSTVYGSLYQWGRVADGHQLRTSQSYPNNTPGFESAPVSDSDLDGNGQVLSTFASYGKFIKNSVIPFDWRDTQLNTLWYDNGKTVNDPCPEGWRVPTQSEWGSIFEGGDTSGDQDNATANTWKWSNSNTRGYLITPPGSSAPTLFLPAGGFRYYAGGGLDFSTINGYYWSSSVYYTYAYVLGCGSENNNDTVSPGLTLNRAYGFSVRCVADQ